FDVRNARAAYAVLNVGGADAGDKFIAVPWQSLSFHPKTSHDDQKFTLNVDKEQLKEAKGFDKDHWPDFANQKWAMETYGFYKQKPYWDTRLEGEPTSTSRDRKSKKREVVRAPDTSPRIARVNGD